MGHRGEPPAETRRRPGFQDAPCRVVLTEVNRFVWPGPDLRPVETAAGPSWSYGLLPARLFLRLRDEVVARARARAARRAAVGVVPAASRARRAASAPTSRFGASRNVQRCWRPAPGQPSRVGQRVRRSQRQALNKEGRQGGGHGPRRRRPGGGGGPGSGRRRDGRDRPAARRRRTVDPWNGGGPRLLTTGRTASPRRRPRHRKAMRFRA